VDARRDTIRFALMLTGAVVGAFGIGYVAAAVWLDKLLRSRN